MPLLGIRAGPSGTGLVGGSCRASRPTASALAKTRAGTTRGLTTAALVLQGRDDEPGQAIDLSRQASGVARNRPSRLRAPQEIRHTLPPGAAIRRRGKPDSL